MAFGKISYVAHVPGHKNSEGKSAPWVIKDHKDDHIISSFGSEAEAKQGLQNMHAHEGSLKSASLPALDDFTSSYIETALWSSTDGDEHLDTNYTFDDIADSTLKVMIDDCQKFQAENAEALSEQSPQMGGHDFWLTRAGHGAGFWDGDWPVNGEALTLASKKYGEPELYVGDDNKIYQMGTEGPLKLTDDDNKFLKDIGSGTGLQASIKSNLLRKQEPKMAFGFSDTPSRQYDYEASGHDVVLISPANVTKLLEGDEARNFWVALDGIETSLIEDDETPEEYQRRVSDLVSTYFDTGRKAAKFVVQVDATPLKKSSVAFVAGVVTKEDGSIEKFKFTASRAKAETFTEKVADKLLTHLKGFNLTAALVKG